jgi:osmotically-inducible protein OsmY
MRMNPEFYRLVVVILSLAGAAASAETPAETDAKHPLTNPSDSVTKPSETTIQTTTIRRSAVGTPADGSVASRIQQEIASDAKISSDNSIQVIQSGDRVSLEGTVKTLEEKQRADQVASRVAGKGIHVKNRLKVSPSP